MYFIDPCTKPKDCILSFVYVSPHQYQQHPKVETPRVPSVHRENTKSKFENKFQNLAQTRAFEHI